MKLLGKTDSWRTASWFRIVNFNNNNNSFNLKWETNQGLVILNNYDTPTAILIKPATLFNVYSNYDLYDLFTLLFILNIININIILTTRFTYSNHNPKI